MHNWLDRWQDRLNAMVDHRGSECRACSRLSSRCCLHLEGLNFLQYVPVFHRLLQRRMDSISCGIDIACSVSESTQTRSRIVDTSRESRQLTELLAHPLPACVRWSDENHPSCHTCLLWNVAGWSFYRWWATFPSTSKFHSLLFDHRSSIEHRDDCMLRYRLSLLDPRYEVLPAIDRERPISFWHVEWRRAIERHCTDHSTGLGYAADRIDWLAGIVASVSDQLDRQLVHSPSARSAACATQPNRADWWHSYWRLQHSSRSSLVHQSQGRHGVMPSDDATMARHVAFVFPQRSTDLCRDGRVLSSFSCIRTLT